MKQRRLILIVATLLLIFTGFFSQAQILKPIKWSFSKTQKGKGIVTLQFKATIDDGWHLYSQYLDDGGPVPTSFEFNKSNSYELIGSVTEPKGIEEHSDLFDMKLKYFDNAAVFTQNIRVKSEKDFILSGFLEFMACDDKQCLAPETVDFEFSIQGVSIPKDDNTTEEVTSNQTIDTAKGNQTTEDTLGQEKKSDTTALEKGKEKTSIETDPTSEDEDTGSLWGFFIFAFLGGLAAILTPCVFPMIPMTVSFFMKTESRSKARMQALVYGFSIIVIFTLIGSIVSVTLGPDFSNWLSTHWIPNVFFFLVFFVFALSFLGMFEIVLPHWMVNKMDQKADSGGFVGSFFMAFTLVLVSFSCTAPIVGSILVLSSQGAVIKPIVGMIGFSLAFAIPFTIFAFYPSKLSTLPKSGGWLNVVKVVLGFIELALGLKFLSVADQTYHWGLLDREVYLALWIVIFGLMGIYLLGKITLPKDSPSERISVPRLLLAVVTLSFVVYLIPGMFGAPLKALSGYLPPQSTHDFDIHKIIRENAGSNTVARDDDQLCFEPKYADFLHLPHGLQGYFDFEQALKCAKEKNKPIFIDFTGHGCVNCREMEARVWPDPRVLKMLREDFIVVALYVDDKTKLPEEDWYKSSNDQKIKKSIGKKYADFQITHFNVNAQPYYVLLDHNIEEGDELEKHLLAKPVAYNLNVDHFINFLEAGLEEFNSRNEGKQKENQK